MAYPALSTDLRSTHTQGHAAALLLQQARLVLKENDPKHPGWYNLCYTQNTPMTNSESSRVYNL